MAIWNNYTVQYLNGSTWTTINKVTDLTFNVGRQLPTDQWQSSNGSIRVFYPTGYTTPIANLSVGSTIRWFAPGRSNVASWTGYVRNIALEVDVPWNATTGTGAADYLVIDCEGELSKLGRANYTIDTNSLNIDMGLAVGRLGTGTGAQVFDEGFFSSSFTVSFPAGTYQALQHLNTLATSANARVIDGVRLGVGTNPTRPAAIVANSSLQTVAPVSFSDTTNDSTHSIYDSLSFDGLADNYFTQVVVNPASVASQTESFGSAPYSTLELSTYNSSTADAYELAALNLNLYKLPTLGVSQLSATSAGQHTQNLDTLGVADAQFGELVMRYALIDFRGSTYVAAIEGATITADTNQTRVTYYLSPATYAGWLTLDDTSLGVLDVNRLAFTDI